MGKKRAAAEPPAAAAAAAPAKKKAKRPSAPQEAAPTVTRVPAPPHGGKAAAVSGNWAKLKAAIGAGSGREPSRRTHGAAPPAAARPLAPQARNGDCRRAPCSAGGCRG